MGTSQSHFVLSTLVLPQSSVLGALLFSIYTSPIGQLIKFFGILHQQYADDTQLFMTISPTAPTDSVHLVEQCLAQLHYWFCLNGLALNPDSRKSSGFPLGNVLSHSHQSLLSISLALPFLYPVLSKHSVSPLTIIFHSINMSPQFASLHNFTLALFAIPALCLLKTWLSELLLL